MLCDISGSMEPYARAYLQFLTCAAGSGPNAEAFVFATRLTRLTRALASRHPERAIQRAAAAAPDWSSGTRIGDALKTFNDRHGRRGMARGAVVVILSDGWERGDPTLVGREMARLAPARAPDRVGQPARERERVLRAGRRHGRGAAALRRAGQRPQLRGARRGGRGDRRARRCGAAGRAGDAVGRPRTSPSRGPAPRRWPGSSVAMPSGHGPSKGSTTPGWVTDDDVTLKTCIYPGCERPAVPPHPLGGPQPAFCDLRGAQRADGSSGAPAPRRDGQRPTTTRRAGDGQRGLPSSLPARPPDRQDGAEPDHRGRRQRAPVRAAGGRRARRPARSTSRSCPPTPTASASATASTRARPTGRRPPSPAPRRRSATRPSCWPGWRSAPRRTR